jgi:hypothetical protein
MACWDRVATYHARRPADILPLFKDLPARARQGPNTATATPTSSWLAW